MSVPARWSVTQPTDLDPAPVEQLPRRPLPVNAKSVADQGRWDCPGHHTPDPIARAAAVIEYAVRLAGRTDLLWAARTQLAGADLACTCPIGSGPCHRDVLLDFANPPSNPLAAGGHAIGLTVRRPWASMLLVPEEVGGEAVDTRTWSTDYRGPVVIVAGKPIDERGMDVARAGGLDAAWHRDRSGWLGAAVLVDIHPARRGCCDAERPRHSGRNRLHHWVFAGPARLALRTHGHGFVGLRQVSWSVLVRRKALAPEAGTAQPGTHGLRP
jgi:Domain of unknown function (DUF4326)